MSDQIVKVNEFLRKPEAVARFTEILGSDHAAKAYVQSVLIAVNSSDELMKCSAQSVMSSALRAASLGLSCDPALKQAWILPYNVKKQDGTWEKKATFVPHYKGLYTLAMRTGKYKTINVSPVYEGQRVMEDPLTGLHAVQDGNFLGEPAAYNSAYSLDVTVRRSKEKKRIGWIGYFETRKGFKKSVWMSAAEIDDHSKQYVKNLEKNQNWNDPEKRPVMEMKTVLRQLLSWADLSGVEDTQLVEALNADAVDAEVTPIEIESAVPAPRKSENDLLKELGAE